jgi:hypothetical protein
MNIDLEMGAEFFSAFNENRFTFRTYSDDKTKGKPIEGFIHGSFDVAKRSLATRNHSKNSVCYNTQITDFKGGGIKNIVGLRSIFIDDDTTGFQRTDFPLLPSLIVQTSPGKYQYTWLFDEPNVLYDEWSNMNHVLIDSWAHDPNCKDFSRILRVPGYIHNKGAPFLVTLVANNNVKYSWEELKTTFGYKEYSNNAQSKSQSSKADGSSARSMQDMIDKITNWIPNSGLHSTIRDFMMMEVKDTNKSEINIVIAVQSFMMHCPENRRDEEWTKYYFDITRQVKDTIRKFKDTEEVVDIGLDDIELNKSQIPWPPGLLGELSQNAFDMAYYGYKEIAISSALSLLAGICGRKFNIDENGLNLYFTIVAGTATGKDSIKRFINGTLISLNGLGNSESFIGLADVTGDKALSESLEHARSKVCVFEEAGLMMATQCGAKEALQKFVLSAYTSSGWNDFCGGKGYSDKAKAIPLLRAVALTIISESTPDIMMESLGRTGSLHNGHLPRQTIFRITCKKPPINRNRKRKVDEHLHKRLSTLITKCAAIQEMDVLKHSDVFHFVCPEHIQKDMFDFCDMCNKIEEDNVNTPLGFMATRCGVKAMKYAALAMVINYDENLVMQDAEWEWGKALAMYELDGVDSFFGGSVGNILDDIAKEIVAPCIRKLLIGKGEIQSLLNSYELKKQYIPYTKLTRETRKKIKIQYDTRFSHADCFRRIIKYMCDDAGYLEKVYNALDHCGKAYKTDVYKPTIYFKGIN